MKFLLVLSFFLLCLPGFAQEDDEKMVRELEAAQQKKAQKVQDLASKFTSSKPPDFALQLKNLGHSTLDAAALMDERVIAILEEGIKHLKMDDVPKEMHKPFIMGRVKGQPLEQVFNRYPKLLDIVADLMSDKEALLGLLGVLKRKEDFKTMGLIIIGITLLGWFIQFLLISREWGFFKRLGVRSVLFAAFFLLNIGVFFQYFRVEMKPTVEIIKKHLRT